MKSFLPSSRVVAFITMMVALGSGLSAVSIGLTSVGQVGVDLSHIATFIAAIYSGPFVGFLVALLAGGVPGIYFGPMGGLAWLGLIGLPIGKALTGLTTGALCRLFNVEEGSHSYFFIIPIVLIGFIPECLFTIVFFLILVPYFFGWVSITLLASILVKAWIEIACMSVLMSALRKSASFSTFMVNFLAPRKV